MKIDAQILFEALGDLDEALLEEAHDTDDQEKLKLLKKNDFNHLIIILTLLMCRPKLPLNK